ncbi:MAG: hypothetical protein JW955_11335 [Sedimentisphaerales bacterium]|nr:hypothetical protein [Sedimentisphaerales bacterium]
MAKDSIVDEVGSTRQKIFEAGKPDIRIGPSAENAFKELRMSSHAKSPHHD